MSFSELLKQCRKKQGVSQAELAAKLGVTQQAVGKWESGKSSPDPSTVARIAELLNTTADYLLGLYRPVSNVSAPEERFFGSYSESLIPVIGTVKAGYGALAFEEDYGQEYARVKDPSNYFYLVVRGDSMDAGKRRPGRADLRRRGRGHPEALHPARQLRGAAALQPRLS